jgi:PD-(D/E)XK nuclease superfamily
VRISNSKLKTFRRCAKQYEYKYVQNLRSKRRGAALERGSWVHELLMVHADGEDWRERHKVLTQQFNNLFEEEREELGDLPTECGRIMRAYLRTYKSDEQRYQVIDTEMDEIITLPNGLKLQIIIDVIVEDLIDGGLWIRDYKTRRSFHDPATIMRDPQLTLYYWGVEHMGYRPLRGAIVDEIRTKAPAIPERLQSGGLTRRKNIDTDVHTYATEIRRFGLDIEDYRDHLLHIAKSQHDRFFRRTSMPKDPPVIRTTMREAVETAQAIQNAERTMRFPRSADFTCEHSCEYKDLCLVELYGGDGSSLIKMNFEVNRRGND